MGFEGSAVTAPHFVTVSLSLYTHMFMSRYIDVYVCVCACVYIFKSGIGSEGSAVTASHAVNILYVNTFS